MSEKHCTSGGKERLKLNLTEEGSVRNHTKSVTRIFSDAYVSDLPPFHEK